MKVRCTYCSLAWGISVRHKIPQSGYECPRCERKRKRAYKRWRLH